MLKIFPHWLMPKFCNQSYVVLPGPYVNMSGLYIKNFKESMDLYRHQKA